MSHSHPSDISREQFARILPTLASARRRTKPRTVDLYGRFLRRAVSFEKRVPVANAARGLPPIGAPATSISGNGASGLAQVRIPFWSKS